MSGISKMQPTVGFENSSPQTQCVRSNRCTQISLGCSSRKRLLPASERTARCNRFPHRLLGHEPNLQIRTAALYNTATTSLQGPIVSQFEAIPPLYIPQQE